MRKKSARQNHRKYSFLPQFLRRRRSDESEWVMLDADLNSGRGISRRSKPRLGWVVRGFAILCLAGSIPFGLKWANTAIFYENEEFVLRQLTIRTDGSLSESKLRSIANVSSGMSLMEIDLGGIESRLEKVPVVKEAIISREMPDKLNVIVKERSPIAWLSCPPLGIRPGDMERGFLLDDEGVLFRCMDLTETVQKLPVIEVYRMDDPVEGQSLEVQGTEGAIELIASSGLEYGTDDLLIHAIKLRNEWSLQCLYRNGLSVTFDLHEIKRGLTDLGVILARTSHLEAPLATVNVAVKKNIPVTFARPVDPSEVSAVAEPVPADAVPVLDLREEMQEKHLRSILNSG
tara:strand:+ start:1063 stop:2100 length:1038 start_codon:yes stop_codon:yes gene_type:complete